MRVLVVHNRYTSRVPSGENLAVDDEARWLVEAGVQVTRHEVTNDDMVTPGAIGRARDGLDAVWSRTAARRVRDVLDDCRPDVVHVHNLFPLLTASVPAMATRRRVPVVWTVHNRRVRCVAGGYFRDGRPCHSCRSGWRLPGVVHGCYADSVPASAVVTAASSLYRVAARRQGVTAVAISDAMRRWLTTEGGFEDRAVRVKYNGVAGPEAPVAPAADLTTFLFLGRLSAYKGVELLLDAWARAGADARLRIVGDGDLAPVVRDAVAADPRIVWAGQVAADRVSDEIADARAVIAPAVWDEPFGRTAAEALAHGRPVITTGTGGLAEIVDDASGWITGRDPDTMAKAIADAASDDDAVTRRGDAARERHARLFSPEATTSALVRVYETAVASK
jgi:glycosyltransferase involved in cell wall biosynthesis